MDYEAAVAAAKQEVVKPYSLGSGQTDVGKRVKASKRRFFWQFMLGVDGKPYKLELVVSVLSGKRVVLLDGREVASTTSPQTTFTHTVPIESHVARIEAKGEEVDASVDFVPFAKLIPRDSLSRSQVVALDLEAWKDAKKLVAARGIKPPPPAPDLIDFSTETVVYQPPPPQPVLPDEGTPLDADGTPLDSEGTPVDSVVDNDPNDPFAGIAVEPLPPTPPAWHDTSQPPQHQHANNHSQHQHFASQQQQQQSEQQQQWEQQQWEQQWEQQQQQQQQQQWEQPQQQQQQWEQQQQQWQQQWQQQQQQQQQQWEQPQQQQQQWEQQWQQQQQQQLHYQQHWAQQQQHVRSAQQPQQEAQQHAAVMHQSNGAAAPGWHQPDS